MIRNLFKGQALRALPHLIRPPRLQAPVLRYHFSDQNNPDDQQDNLENLKKLRRNKNREKQTEQKEQQQKNKKENIDDSVEDFFKNMKKLLKNEEVENSPEAMKRNLDKAKREVQELKRKQKEKQLEEEKIMKEKQKKEQEALDRVTKLKREKGEGMDGLMDKIYQIHKRHEQSEETYQMDPEEKKQLVDQQIAELKRARYKLILKQNAKHRVYQSKGMELSGSARSLKENVADLEKEIKSQEEPSPEQLEAIAKLKELESQIEAKQKEKEELQVRINKVLVQQQLIKNEKMKRRIKSTQKERESITQKMARLEQEQEGEKEQKGEEEKKEEPQKQKKNILMMTALLTLLNINSISDYVYSSMFMDSLSYEYFVKELLEKRQVARLVLNKYTLGHHHMYEAQVVDTHGKNHLLPVGNADHFLENLEAIQLNQMALPPSELLPVDFAYPSHNKTWLNVLNDGLSLGLGLLILFSVLKGGAGINNGIFGATKKIKKFGVDTKVAVKFKDVAGQAGAKQEISEFVEFLRNPKKFTRLGAKLPRGALLTGPPGTGKTLLAKATAGEAEVPFYYLSGSDFVEMYVGVGASRVRDLFKQARKKQPSIIFIDEIDAIGKKREDGLGKNQERENTLNQLLVEMDGFDSTSEVIILAATNQHQLLDKALTRPGRFDRQVTVDLPDLPGRKEILLIHLAPLRLHPDQTPEEYAKRLATLTPGFSGAELANLCNEAAIHASRKNKDYVDKADFEMATERVIAGIEKKSLLSQKERETVAVHESGHAIVSWFLEGGIPLLKLTIIPRSKGSLGFAQYLPNENTLETKQELLDRLCIMLGGRMAEQHFFGEVTTGASDDLQKVYSLAHNIVTKFGMSSLGYVAFRDEDYQKHVSDKTQDEIDRQIVSLIAQQTQRSKDTIAQHSTHVQNLSQALLQKETLDLKDIIGILGERPFPPKDNYKAYIDAKEIMA